MFSLISYYVESWEVKPLFRAREGGAKKWEYVLPAISLDGQEFRRARQEREDFPS